MGIRDIFGVMGVRAVRGKDGMGRCEKSRAMVSLKALGSIGRQRR